MPKSCETDASISGAKPDIHKENEMQKKEEKKIRNRVNNIGQIQSEHYIYTMHWTELN